MKKLLLSIFAGAVVLGIGLGVTALEISEWDMAHYPAYLDVKPMTTCEFTQEINVQQLDKARLYAYRTFSGDERNVEIVADDTLTDSFIVKVEYRGEKPQVDNHSWADYDENDMVKEHIEVTVSPQYSMSFKDIKQALQEMFETKIFYRELTNTLIEKVTVYTAYPEKFEILA